MLLLFFAVVVSPASVAVVIFVAVVVAFVVLVALVVAFTPVVLVGFDVAVFIITQVLVVAHVAVRCRTSCW